MLHNQALQNWLGTFKLKWIPQLKKLGRRGELGASFVRGQLGTIVFFFLIIKLTIYFRIDKKNM